MVDTHDSRSGALEKMAARHFPGLYLHSRVGTGAFGDPLPRLRFDSRSAFGWLRKLFLNPSEAESRFLAMTITGYDHCGLNLSGGYADVEVHVYNHGYFKVAEKFAAEYTRTTGRSAVLVLEAGERTPSPPFFRRFAFFSVALIALILSARVLSAFLINYFLSKSP